MEQPREIKFGVTPQIIHTEKKEKKEEMEWHKLAEDIFKNLKESNASSDIFKRYRKRISKLLIAEEIALKSGDEKTLMKINTFAIHYLMKGAKFPLLPESESTLKGKLLKGTPLEGTPLKGSPFDLSLLDYTSFTRATYYRSEASSIGTVYEEVLKKQGYGEIFNQCHVIPCKSVKWKRLLKGYREWVKMVQVPKKDEFSTTESKPEKETSLPLSAKVAREKGFDQKTFLQELGKFKENYITTISNLRDEGKDPASYMLDISPLLNGPNGSPLPPKELSERLNLIIETLKECNVQLKKRQEIVPKVFGMAKLEDGQSAVLLFKEKIEKRGNKEPSSTKTVNENIKKELETILNKGYRPDLPIVEQGFAQRGLSLKELSSLASKVAPPKEKNKSVTQLESFSPKTPSISLKEKKEEIKNKLKSLGDLTKKNTDRKDYIYYAYLSDLFEQIDTESLKQNDLSQAVLHQSLDIVNAKLGKHLTKITENNLPMEILLKDVDLIVEEFILQLNFAHPAKLKETITKLSEVEGLEKMETGYAYTSSMNAFAQLLPALYHSHGRSKPLNVVSINSIYFETGDSLLNQAKIFVDPLGADGKGRIPNLSQADAVFVDFYPNNAPIADVKQRPIQELVPLESLMERKEPLTLVIDTSAAIFYEKNVKDVIKHYGQAIKAGKLNIVVINSLAKFSMCGLDKYQGGAMTVYNNNNSIVFKDFNALLEEYEKKEPLSPQASAFFNLFLSKPQMIEYYKYLINQNTTEMYKQLLTALPSLGSKDTNTGLLLVERPNTETPLIAIHFGDIINRMAKEGGIQDSKVNLERLKGALCPIMKDYIVYLARTHYHLPLSKRPSFGFAHSNLSDAHTALRLTVGLESPEQITAYATLLNQANDQLIHVSPVEVKGFAEWAMKIAPKKLTEATEKVLQKNPKSLEETLKLVIQELKESKSKEEKKQVS